MCFSVMSMANLRVVEDVEDSISEWETKEQTKDKQIPSRFRVIIYNAMLAAAAMSKRLLSGALNADNPMYAGSLATMVWCKLLLSLGLEA